MNKGASSVLALLLSMMVKIQIADVALANLYSPSELDWTPPNILITSHHKGVWNVV